ncbi:MAG: hypothetical protein FWH19_04825, partial [Treponema sp.]|nr:hypothetical protein [Treponema sp.]
MKIKVKLTFMGIAMTVVVAAAISFVLANRASNISMGLSVAGLEYLADNQSEYWNGRVNGHLRALKTIADQMAAYHNYPVQLRRDIFDEMIRGALDGDY